jgi:hypothetical protein
MAALNKFVDTSFTPATHPILPRYGQSPWHTSAFTIDHSHINNDIDMKPTHHLTLRHPPPPLRTGRRHRIYYLPPHMHGNYHPLPRLDHPPPPFVPTRIHLDHVRRRITSSCDESRHNFRLDAPTKNETHKTRRAAREHLVAALRKAFITTTELDSHLYYYP